MLDLRTFGGVSVEQEGAPGAGSGAQRKTLALLALLAAHPRGLSRDKIVAYLWPESDAKHGRGLLKQACYALRRDLGEHELFLGSTELRLNSAVLSSDVQRLEDALAHGDLRAAVAVYRGAFLDGFFVDGLADFERWADSERSRLAKRVCMTLETLATEAAAQGDHRAAAERWRQLAVLDPLSARAARGVMTALAALGEVAAGLQHGRAYETLVREELGTTPEAGVSQLIGRLRLEPAAAEGVTVEDLRQQAVAARGRHTVGYEQERGALRAALDAAVQGRGAVLCVSGEPGSGKTTLVEDFLSELGISGRPCHVARGRCSERLAGSGAYLPLLDALEGLLRGDSRGAVTQLMKQVAPNWHAQLTPSLDAVQAASQERLKREFAAFLREVCRLRPLVVFLDDVHWVDASTVDILSYVGTQMAAAQMLMIAAFRPAELQLGKHPFGSLKLELQAAGLCREVTLGLLTREDVDAFLELEYPNHRFPPTFARFVHAKTEGSPLFMVDLLRYLRGKHVIVADNGGWKLAGSVPNLERELPETVRSMIERKIEQLAARDRQLLVAAGVQGYEFDSPIVARVLGADAGEVEEQLDVLGRVHAFVQPVREHALPDGTPAVRYRFVHVLYQNALCAGLTATRRQSQSLAVAEALLAHYGERSTEVAAELALLFEAAREMPRAVDYFSLAAQHAAGVFGYREAAALARRGLELLAALPDTAERAGRELMLQLTLGFALNATHGSSNRETGRCMTRARELCRQLGEPPALFPAMLGLWSFYLVSSEQQAARETAARMLEMAGEVQDPVWLFGAHTVLGASLTHMAEHTTGLGHLERAKALYDPLRRPAYTSLYRQDLGVYCGGETSRTLWLLGYPERARHRMEEMLALARDAADPQATAFALIFAVIAYQFRREPELAQEQADALIALCDEHGTGGHREWGMTVRGWALAEQGLVKEGIVLMREHIDALRAKDMLVEVPYFLSILAETLEKAGQIDEGIAAVADALDIAQRTNQPVYMAEYLRLRGELLAKGGGALTDAEASLREALTIANCQEAKSLELRAATSLARHWQCLGKKDDARALLAPAYGWFTEGFDTRDLQDAKKLLDALM